jgi:hypothetical protein
MGIKIDPPNTEQEEYLRVGTKEPEAVVSD